MVFAPDPSTDPGIVNVGIGINRTVPRSATGVNVFCRVTGSEPATITWLINNATTSSAEGTVNIVASTNGMQSELRHRFSMFPTTPQVYRCIAEQTINNQTRRFMREVTVTGEGV